MLDEFSYLALHGSRLTEFSALCAALRLHGGGDERKGNRERKQEGTSNGGSYYGRGDQSSFFRYFIFRTTVI